MSDRSVVIIGLPGSGKTTYLAALWHLILERDVPTALQFQDLLAGETAHLNRIAARWRDAKEQDRTELGGDRLVSMNLSDSEGPVRVTFPDVAGEGYRRMWEDRECDPEIASFLADGGVLLFIHANKIRPPQWIVDEVALSRSLGLDIPEGQPVPWSPRLAPTQVQVVGLLQLLRTPPLDTGPRRLAVMLSAWDKAAPEGLSPQAYLEAKMPLLGQYLRRNADEWTSRIYGLSAQGGDYDSIQADAAPRPEAAVLRGYDRPSERIRLQNGTATTHDLTEPLSWLFR